MRITTLSGSEVSILTPQDILRFRELLITNKARSYIIDKTPVTPEIEANIAAVVKIHGLANYDFALRSLSNITYRLEQEYSFKHGLMTPLGYATHIPDWFYRNKDEKGIHSYLEYAANILSAFGWIVTPSEDDSYYYFDLAPLHSVTYEEADLENDHQAAILAAKSLQKINAGILKRKYNFTPDDLGLPDGLSGEDWVLFYEHLVRLMPAWNLRLASGHIILIYPL